MTLTEKTESYITNENSSEVADENDQNEENIIELQEDWGDEYNDVVTFLCGLHLNEYVETFVSQGITLDIFLHLTEDDLCHIGMTNSKHRSVLLQGVKQLRGKKTNTVSEVQLSHLSDEEASTVLSNTVKHLTVIHASLAHTRLSLRNPCVHNSLINLKLTMAELLEVMAAEAEVQAQLVTNQVNAILAKRPGAVEKKPIKRWKISLTLLSGVGVAFALYIYLKKQ